MANKAVNKKKKGMSGEDLAGMHIYKDDHNRYVYYNVFDHVGYILNDIPKYKTYSSRFIVGLIGGILAYSFDLGALLSIIIGVAAYALMEVKFRLFLKKQTQIPNFKPKERPLRLLTAASEETKKIYMKIAAYLLFGILIILLPFSEGGYDDLLKAMCIALGILAIGVSLFQVRALFYKKANPSLTDKK